MPLAPPTMATSPKLPLCEAWRRFACAGAGFSQALGCSASGQPSVWSQTWPLMSRPWQVNTPGLRLNKLRVWVARTQGPSAAPVSASSPLGRSAETTGIPAVFICAIHSAQMPCAASRRPVPSSASMQRSHVAGGPAWMRRPNAVAFSRARSASFAYGLSPSGMLIKTSLPQVCRWQAASRPSPPLLPLPQATQICRA